MERVFAVLQRWRSPVLLAYDFSVWVIAYTSMAGVTAPVLGDPFVAIVIPFQAGIAAGLIFVVGALPLKLHLGRAAVGSFEEAVLLTPVAAFAGGIVLVVDLAGHSFRATIAVAAPVLALVMMLWVRGAYRVIRERRERVEANLSGEPVVVIGAGWGARHLVQTLIADPRSPWRPVALLDDDPHKRYRRIREVPVVGKLADLTPVAQRFGARTVILAIPTASTELVSSLVARAAESGLTLKALSPAWELKDAGGVAIADIRDIDVTDLLGRRQIETDVPAVAGYLAGKRVLVTGAGGSIGSELCRQIAEINPRELIMLDRDEGALHAVELSIYGTALLDGENTVLGDIRDTQFVNDLFASRRPEVVFHAAALKHLPLLEKAPGEAVKTNVWGTLAVLEAAAANGVDRFVNVSTDKAANPTSVLGYSKRLAEGLTAAIAPRTPGTFLSVRFGNVLGSRGSVLHTFAAQIESGGPITVTDPGVTRYFMTIGEAVQLVIQAGAIGRPGEVLVLDMGEPVSIDSLARQLIDLSGRDITVTYTGLRHGEKMHEELFGDGEVDLRPEHPLISHAEVPAYDHSEARALAAWERRHAIIDELKQACDHMKGQALSV